MTFVDELNRVLVPKLVGMRDAWEGFQKDLDRQRMTDLLVETYHYIRHSVPLMELAASHCRRKWPQTAEYFEHHVEEEKDHDVWLLEDLAGIGLQPQEVKGLIPLRPTLGMVASQYFLIERVNPVSVLGYMYILEGLTPKPESIEKYAARAGLPQEALRTILEHAELDPHHISDMREALSSEELSREDQRLISFNSTATVEYLTEMYRAIGRQAQARSLEAAAVSA